MSMIFNPDTSKVDRIIELLRKKNGHCPCQVEVSDDTLCPCKDFYTYNQCHCKLFIESGRKEFSQED